MAYREMWEIEVRHDGLNKYRHIRGSDRYVVEQKAAAQKLAWDEMWQKKQTAVSKEEKKELAIAKTDEARSAIEGLESIIKYTLSVGDAIDWLSLLDKEPFPQHKPAKPIPETIPAEPNRSDSKYQPNLGLFDKILSGSRKRKQEEAENLYLTDRKTWEEEKIEIELWNADTESQYAKSVKQWENEKAEYEKYQKSHNELIQKKKEQYLNKEVGAVSGYCEMVLSNSVYPEYFPQEWDLEYQSEPKILIVDYVLPDIESIPTVNSVKYIVAMDEFVETYLSSTALNKLYDNLLYQIALRTIHELYEADVVELLYSIVFNGWVDAVDKATGQNVNSCIMSLQASRNEFLAINLEKVDPKACFKQLKGVGSSKLHGLSSVAPIISINKEDRRFISAYTVIDEIDGTDNLAVMDWKDFENLIRELFEKEFVHSGGEVKITQASRDGGVDAVAFDPDPIRGGKIVIQAKRYTNVVGVSAVRDLYGTTLNEGATKGILVTTADYGPDAYEFAKGKPLTLLNGSNLLHLLEKHGHKAKINLKEAKRILNEQKI